MGCVVARMHLGCWIIAGKSSHLKIVILKFLSENGKCGAENPRLGEFLFQCC